MHPESMEALKKQKAWHTMPGFKISFLLYNQNNRYDSAIAQQPHSQLQVL